MPVNPTIKYALGISAETEEKISKLNLPDGIPEEAREICNRFGVTDTASLRACVRAALKKPYFQGERPNCYAVAPFVRWQADNPSLIIEMLRQFFSKGFFEFWDASHILRKMEPVSDSNYPGSVVHFLVNSIAGLHEDENIFPEGRVHTYSKAYDFFSQMHGISKKLSSSSFLSEEYATYMRAQAKILSDKKTVPFDWKNPSKNLDNGFVATGGESGSPKYDLGDIFRFYYERQKLSFHACPYGFRLSIPFNSFLKMCGMPSSLRKAVFHLLSANEYFHVAGDDIVAFGHKSFCPLFFSSDAILYQVAKPTPEKLLEALLDIKKTKELPSGQLIPFHCTIAHSPSAAGIGHAANMIIPAIDSVADVKDGEFIPIIWTNWLESSQIGVVRRGSSWEFVDGNGRHRSLADISIFDPEKCMFSPKD
jgi:hypothetical protein